MCDLAQQHYIVENIVLEQNCKKLDVKKDQFAIYKMLNTEDAIGIDEYY